jgi:endonuclease/exonuclease/phosphatase (EEP) superfamily protein YafD
MVAGRAVLAARDLSDHLPVLADFKLRNNPKDAL